MFRRVSGGRKESSVELSRFLLDVSITREVDNFSAEEVKGRKWKIGLPIVFRSGVLCGNRKQLRTSFQHVQSLSLSLFLSMNVTVEKKDDSCWVTEMFRSYGLPCQRPMGSHTSSLPLQLQRTRTEAGENKGR
jgi:hypothetical protein